ncbi:outer membrane receptor protein involved in Fe transport [Aquimarina sp. MAR_2010_214]|uniref:carboxypeptidase-like regulatory domain-containing protein n=1 Tax=Aquimarina sp. MAR_2010_214 TaxID=1250026 RepID=UPI000C7070F9|nr:carboxypeptidase-like regulatory domain-containing protein [Aquimarina sp. MAR_2010_214]PKV48927.1 outer membrane receptor protein involved in Fe transport [Aquimarina sp. MAR_2010_214]
MKKTLLLLFFCTYSLQSQITKDYSETPLQQVLNELSESYNLIFSFSNETVKNKIITLTVNNTPIDEILITLKTLTNLNFKKISNRQVIVSSPNNKVEVCGYLFDETTNEPLSYASISIESTKTGTIANDDGFFQLGTIDENTSITIQYVGYKDKVIKASSFKTSDCPRIPLFIESTSLAEVLIVEYITTGIDKNIDGSFRISNEELGILPGQSEPDIMQSIQLIPGINSPDETATGIQIRGGSPDQNLVLWDNIKMYNTGHFFGMFSAFNPNIVKSAKIFKGGADPRYGDRASGIIDISSDKKVPEKFNGGTGVNGTHADVFMKVPVAKTVGLVISGRRSYTDIFETPTYKALSEKVFQNTKIVKNPNQTPIPGEEDDDDDDEEEREEAIAENNFFFYDASTKLIIDASENDKILASTIYTNNDLAFEINDEEDLITDNLKIQNKGASFSWEGTKLKHFDHSLKAYYSKYDSDYLFTKKQELQIEKQSIRKNTVEDVGLDLNIAYDLNTKNSLMLGYQFSNNEVFYAITREAEFETPLNGSGRVKNNANTMYVNYKFLPKNKSFINLGLRASHYSIVNKLYLEPRVNIEYPFTNFLRMKVTGELRYQPISQLIEFEDTQLRLENNLWIHANEEVPVLKSTQFSTGFLFSKKGWNFEIDGYYKNINGLTSITNGFSTINRDLSTGESIIYGIDVLLKKKFKNFRTWLGYTFNDIKYTFPEIQEASFPGNNDITHNFRISNTYKINDWEFSLGWLWRSGAPFTDAGLVNDKIKYGAINAKRLPEYHRLDISAIYRFDFNKTGNWRGQIGASIQNLYNRQVPVSISYRVDDNATTGEIELDKLRQQSLGITPNVVLRIYF